MTAVPESPALVISGPDCLPSVVPHLLGFHPDASLVLIGLERGSRRVRVTLRVDLPPDDGTPLLDEAATDVLVRVGATDALLVVYPGATENPWRGRVARRLPRRQVVGQVADLLTDAGVDVVDALCVVGDRLRSYWCRDHGCCPPEGRRVPGSAALLVDAEFVGRGSAPMPSRSALVDVLAPRADDDPLVVAYADELRRTLPDVPGLGADDVASFLVGLTVHGARPQEPHLLPALAALASALCSWVRPRDLLMRALSVDADPAVVALARSVLVEAVRCSRGPDVAPVASLLAVCSWLGGDGAFARVSLDRAERADPGYSLAALLGQALDSGVPPWTWSQMMADVTVERLLATGDGPPRRLPEVVAGELFERLGLEDDRDPL